MADQLLLPRADEVAQHWGVWDEFRPEVLPNALLHFQWFSPAHLNQLNLLAQIETGTAQDISHRSLRKPSSIVFDSYYLVLLIEGDLPDPINLSSAIQSAGFQLSRWQSVLVANIN
jgi:hypothetical protein